MINKDKYKDFYHFLPFFTTLLKTFTFFMQIIGIVWFIGREIDFEKINPTNVEKISTLNQNI